MKALKVRLEAIRKRFPEREPLSKEQLHFRYFANLPKNSVIECLSAIEEDYQVEVGFLRPDDSLYALLGPVPTWNPVRWVLYRAIESDGLSELQYKLAKRTRNTAAEPVRTFGELVERWARGTSS